MLQWVRLCGGDKGAFLSLLHLHHPPLKHRPPMVLLVRAEEAQRLFQHRNVNRLGKVHVHARIHALLDVVRKGVRGHRDNSRGNCGEQVCKDDEDEIAVWRCRLLVYKKYAYGDRFSRVSVSYI